MGTHSETEGKDLVILSAAEVVGNEGRKALCAEIEAECVSTIVERTTRSTTGKATKS